jgi:hypothetical protein
LVVLAACDKGGGGGTSASAQAEASGPLKVTVPDGPVTADTLLLFVPKKLGGHAADMRQRVDEALVAGAYRTPTGYINLNLSLSRSTSFDRAQSEGKEQIKVGRFAARNVVYESGSKTELRMFVGDRINVDVTREGKVPIEQLIAIAAELDLDGLDALAKRVPAPKD